LAFRKTEIFFRKGLDRANQIDLVEEIKFSAQGFCAAMKGEAAPAAPASSEASPSQSRLICPSGGVDHRAHLQTNAGLLLQETYHR
jgi:hypothetical protein